MKKIGDLITNIQKTIVEPKTEMPKIELSEEAVNMVNYLFKIFSVHIPTFSFYTKDDESLNFAKQEWVYCFQKSKLGKEHVINGANKIRESGLKYMPTPADFIELCMTVAKQDDFKNSNILGLEHLNEWRGLSDEQKETKRAKGCEQLKNIKSFLL